MDPASIVRRLRHWWGLLWMDAPYKEVADYEGYWEGREEGTLSRAYNLQQYIGKDDMVLDVGCGDGAFMKFFQEKGVKIEGTEVSTRAIGLCKKKGLSVKYADFLDDATRVSKTYEFIACLHVFEHVQDPEKMLSKFKGRARKGVFVAIPNAGFFVYRLRFLFGRFPVTQVEYHMREHVRFWTVRDFKEWCGAQGYRVKKVIPNDRHPLARVWPSLFSERMIYWIVPR